MNPLLLLLLLLLLLFLGIFAGPSFVPLAALFLLLLLTFHLPLLDSTVQ